MVQMSLSSQDPSFNSPTWHFRRIHDLSVLSSSKSAFLGCSFLSHSLCSWEAGSGVKVQALARGHLSCCPRPASKAPASGPKMSLYQQLRT